MLIPNWLLASVLNCPKDNQPRLMCADWLEIEGRQPQYAEFIRIQCLLDSATTGTCHLKQCHFSYTCPACRKLSRQEMGFLQAFARSWFHLPCEKDADWIYGLSQPGWTGTSRLPSSNLHHLFAIVNRGFVETIYVRLQDWFYHGADIAQNQPIEKVILQTEHNYL